MKTMKLIAGVAFACLMHLSYAQTGTASDAHDGDAMATISKELALTPEQQSSFTKAMDACQRDCASIDARGQEKGADMKKQRGEQLMTNLRAMLTAEQAKKWDAMKAKGDLNALCGADGKACCAKGGGRACCAGHAKPTADAEQSKGLKAKPAPVKGK